MEDEKSEKKTKKLWLVVKKAPYQGSLHHITSHAYPNKTDTPLPDGRWQRVEIEIEV